MALLNRRSFLVDVPRGAAAVTVLTAAFALGSARGSESTPTHATPLCDAESEPHPPATADTAPAPAAPDQASAPRRTQPLPMPSEAAWRQEWLDLLSLASGRPNLGC